MITITLSLSPSLFPSLHFFACLSFYLPISTFLCLSLRLSSHLSHLFCFSLLSPHLSISLPVFLSPHLSISLPVSSSISPSFNFFACLSFYLHISPFLCLSLLLSPHLFACHFLYLPISQFRCLSLLLSPHLFACHFFYLLISPFLCLFLRVEMIPVKVHDEMMRKSTERAQRAESKVSSLEQEVSLLRLVWRGRGAIISPPKKKKIVFVLFPLLINQGDERPLEARALLAPFLLVPPPPPKGFQRACIAFPFRKFSLDHLFFNYECTFVSFFNFLL